MKNIEDIKFENMILKKRLAHFDRSFAMDALEALELIKQAVEKPVRVVTQIDAFVNDFDSVVVPDKDGGMRFRPDDTKRVAKW